MKKLYKTFLFLCISVCLSCEDFVKVNEPKTQLVSESVFSDEATAEAALLGIYTRMFNSGVTLTMTYSNALASDEMIAYSVDSNLEFYNNALLPTSSTVSSVWNEFYQYIYAANLIIENTSANTQLSLPVRDQLTGEARFIRAFCYFYLVNLWGDIPLITQSSYQVSINAKRDSKADVMSLIIEDLKSAINLLSDDFSSSGNERLRPNKFAAMALLARTYLFQEDWNNAEIYSTQVIEASQFFNLEEDLNSVFLAESREAIWQLTSGYESGVNTYEGEIYILVDEPTASLSTDFMDSFEAGDDRKDKWTGEFSFGDATYFYPFKYKIQAGGDNPPVTEYLIVFRLAEIYLIRAEARAASSQLSASIADVDLIRGRANLPLIQNINPEITKEGLLSEITKQRKIELFAEWSHRWLDLKRLNIIDQVLSDVKPWWQTTYSLYPIPQSEMERAVNLRPQNPGY